jgi:hypothetical protein
MQKKTILPREGKLKNACNESHYFVKKFLPERYQSPKYDKMQAAIEGSAAGFTIAFLLEKGLETLLGDNGLGVDPNLKFSHLLEFGGLFFTLGTITMSNIIAPHKVKEWINENPVYSVGVFGVMGGASIHAAYDLLKFIS